MSIQNVKKYLAYQASGSSQAMNLGTELLLLAIVAIFVAVGVEIAQPALNDLTTGVSPIISPTSTAGTLIPYVGLFLILAYIVGVAMVITVQVRQR